MHTGGEDKTLKSTIFAIFGPAWPWISLYSKWSHSTHCLLTTYQISHFIWYWHETLMSRCR